MPSCTVVVVAVVVGCCWCSLLLLFCCCCFCLLLLLLFSTHFCCSPFPFFCLAGHLIANKSILWVDPKMSRDDDHNTLIQFLKTCAKQVHAECHFFFAYNAAKAISIMQSRDEPYDLIISNYGTFKNALQILRAMRDNSVISADKLCPLILYSTTLKAEQKKQEVMRLGAFRYCSGPASLLKAIVSLFSPIAVDEEGV